MTTHRTMFAAALAATILFALSGNARADFDIKSNETYQGILRADSPDQLGTALGRCFGACNTSVIQKTSEAGMASLKACKDICKGAASERKQALAAGPATPTTTDKVAKSGKRRTNKAPANKAPVIGIITVLESPLQITVDAVVTDDGLPNPPAKITRDLSIISGPGAGKISQVNDTLALDFEKPGKYVLRFSVSDGELNTGTDITVDVPDKVQQPICSTGACLPLPESIGCHLRFWLIVTGSVLLLLIILIFGTPKIGKRKFRGVLGYYKAWKQAERARGAISTPPPIPTDKK